MASPFLSLGLKYLNFLVYFLSKTGLGGVNSLTHRHLGAVGLDGREGVDGGEEREAAEEHFEAERPADVRGVEVERDLWGHAVVPNQLVLLVQGLRGRRGPLERRPHVTAHSPHRQGALRRS